MSKTRGGEMHAFILAGGKGVRLRPYTTNIPKPLVPIGDEYSILEIVMRQLAAQGFTRATIAIGHLGHVIRAYVGDGSQWDITVDYHVEDSPLGTMGPVVRSLDSLPEHFLVMNGDILTDLSFRDLLLGHARSDAPMTIATYDREVKIDFGVLEIEGRHLRAFTEKPTVDHTVSMGVYAISREVLRAYTPGLPFGFDELVLDLLRRGTPPAVHPFKGYWLDIGRPDDYDRANEEFPAVRADLLPGTPAPTVRAGAPGG
jgi:NDP-sugar pyrophosphorylase family protein